MAGALGSVVGAALFGADPVQYLLGLPHWHSAYAYHVVSACAGLAILALGIFLLVRIARAMRTEPAAANMRLKPSAPVLNRSGSDAPESGVVECRL